MKKILFTLLFMGIFSIGTALSQPTPPPVPDKPEQAPIGGLAVLAVAGGAYAIKKLHNKK